MVGEIISHYRILERISDVGMGVVYQAEDINLGRKVAIKFLPHKIESRSEKQNRFILEAKALATINHPNIATIYELGESEDKSFIVMEYIEGHSLRNLLEDHTDLDVDKLLSVDRIINFAIQIANGLQSAHQKGIVHRDIKPENIMIDDMDQIKILDFGLAKITGWELVTKEGITMGTVAYMSPEQTTGESVDLRTDIWSVGVILYEMITGHRPFKGEYEQAVIYSILNETPKAIQSYRQNIPESLKKIVVKALAKNPNERYQSCDQLLEDLESCLLSNKSVGKAEKELIQKSQKKSNKIIRYFYSVRRRIKISWGIIITVLILGAIGIYIFMPNSQNKFSLEKKIAVLPFVNMSNDPADEYFSEGIMDDILTYLYKIGELQVISRTTMRQYKETNKSIREIGNELNVSAILEGSVHREGNQIHIVVQLIDARNDDHLWAEIYDRKMEDVFIVQTEIAQKIASALHAKLSESELSSLNKPSIINIETYNLQLEGEYFLSKGDRENVEKAVEKFRQTISIDSSSARSWAYLATAYARLADLGALNTEEGYSKAKWAASIALLLDDNYAQGHTIMGWIKRSYDWDWIGAETECRRALELAPGDITVIRNMANLNKTLGKFDEAITLIKKAIVLDPKWVPLFTSFGLFSFYANHLEDAASGYNKAIELNPKYPAAHTFLGLVYLYQGEKVRAIKTIKQETDEGWRCYGLAQAYYSAGMIHHADSSLQVLISDYGEDSAYQIAEAFAYRDQTDRALEWLEKAYSSHDGGLSELIGDPFMKKLEKDPRYVIFLRKMNLPN